MKILAIECTHQIACVAVNNGSRVVERASGEWQKTAEAIVPLIMQVMSEAGIGPAELDGVAVSSGPGSFTALRIGMSVAKGIAYGVGCPLVPVSTLHAMALSACGFTAAAHLVPVIPSRPGEFFFGIYRRQSGSCILEELDRGRCLAGELSDRLDAFAGNVAIPVRDVDEFVRHAPRLSQNCIDATFFSAASLLSMAEVAMREGVAALPGEASPDYRQIFVPLQKKQ